MVSRTRIWLCIASAALVAVGVGCGSKQQADLANGKSLFVGDAAYKKTHPHYQACGGCHTLTRAGSKGNAGPDLDAAFSQARSDGMTKGTVQGVVRDQIRNPRRGSVMPRDLVTGKDANDVAAYVATVAGIPGKDTGELALVGGSTNTKPIAAKGGVLTMPADPTRTLFASTNATAPAGKLTVKMPNPSSQQHDIALKDGPKGAVVGGGGVSTFTATLKPGKYQYLCTVPGHAANGMTGTLTVK